MLGLLSKETQTWLSKDNSHTEWSTGGHFNTTCTCTVHTLLEFSNLFTCTSCGKISQISSSFNSESHSTPFARTRISANLQ